MQRRNSVRHRHVKNLPLRPAQSTDVLTVAFCAVAVRSYPQKREISLLWGYNNLIILLFLLTESIAVTYGKK